MHDRPVLQLLEPRRFLSAVYPTATDQYLVELVNRARANPTAEATRDGVALNEGLAAGTISTAAKQPLAINPYLTDSSTKHSQWMIDTDTFSHTGVNGTDPGQRMTNAGYVFSGNWTWGENIAWSGTTGSTPNLTSTTAQLHKDLFVDKGIADRGHRTNLMDPDYKEIGSGVLSGNFTGYNAVMATEDFATTGTASFLTGVAYTDAKVRNKFYDVGEGLGGITVKATRTSDHKVFSTKTWSSGGYSLRLSAGTYTVVASGAGLGTVSDGTVTIGSMNVKKDFRTPIAAASAPGISGTVFNDLDGDHVRDPSESGLAGWTAYLDLDNDGRPDANEPIAVTDAAGAFHFDVSPGTYVLRLKQPTNWRLTTPAQTITVSDTLVTAKAIGEHK